MLKLLKAVSLAAPLALVACTAEVSNKEHKPASIQTESSSDCSLDKAENIAHEILSPYGIKPPRFEASSGVSQYTPTTGLISLRECAPDEVVAHEIGHYVFDVFVMFDYGQHIVKAQSLFCPDAPDCPGPWGPKDESHPGIEVSAHCISELLYKKTRFTECPSQDFLDKAAEILSSLSSRA